MRLRRDIALEIRPEALEERLEARLPDAGAQSAQHAQRLLVQIFRQIDDARLDLVMDGMAFLVRWPAHGDEGQIEAGALEAQQFLRNERFGQTRIALQNDQNFPAV